MEVWLSDLCDKARCRFPQNRCLCIDKISAFPTIFGLQASAQTIQGRQVPAVATIAQLGHVALWQ